MKTHVLSIAFTLFLLMDAIGNLPIFLALLKHIPSKKQPLIILRELLIALIVIIAFAFIGDALLSSMGISTQTVLISGGLILFLIAIKMIFPSKKDTDMDNGPDKEPFIVPLAVPLIAGPAVLAAVMLYSKEENSQLVLISGIVIAWVASTLILLCSGFLKRILGMRGIIACERLMGLILTLISVEMLLKGFSQWTHPS